MESLKDKIRRDGKVRGTGILKVDSFLNHQIDVTLLGEIGAEFATRFQGCGINKILTIEASGIGIACVVAQYFDSCPVVFAKKNQTKNIVGDVYTSQVESFTHGRSYDIIVSKQYLNEGDNILIVDDFLANGAALKGLIDLANDAGANIVGAGIVVEKAFQPGGDLIREMGIRVESLARIQSLNEDTGIVFVGE